MGAGITKRQKRYYEEKFRKANPGVPYRWIHASNGECALVAEPRLLDANKVNRITKAEG